MWFDATILYYMKEALNYNDEDFQRLGRFNAKFNIFTRFFLRHLISLNMTAKQIPKMWRTYYTVGELENPEYSEEKKYSILRVINFPNLPKIVRF